MRSPSLSCPLLPEKFIASKSPRVRHRQLGITANPSCGRETGMNFPSSLYFFPREHDRADQRREQNDRGELEGQEVALEKQIPVFARRRRVPSLFPLARGRGVFLLEKQQKRGAENDRAGAPPRR